MSIKQCVRMIPESYQMMVCDAPYCIACKEMKEAHDPYPFNWIELSRFGSLTDASRSTFCELHFCSLNCLNDWINSQTLDHRKDIDQS